MGTIMGDWRELRSCAVVMLLIAGVSATTVSSCGGGGGDSNGELCQQCGDSDGPCQDTADVTGDDRPSFCGAADPCTVALLCLRKLDSAQRRCFPAQPTDPPTLDIPYRCDGARPNPSVVPMATPTPVPTFTPSAAPTPTSTGPTATGATATPTGSTPTPTPTATPDEVAVNITIDNDDGEFTGGFTATVKYTASKGNFLTKDGATDCQADDDGLTPEDDGSGILTLAFPGDSDGAFAIGVACTFHQDAGPPLVDSDLDPSITSPNRLTIEIDSL